jgi:hypothetical protein
MKFAVGQRKLLKKQADESDIDGLSVLLQEPSINRTEGFLVSIF